MKTIGIILLAIFAILVIIFFGAICYVALAARCMDCPYQDQCEKDKDFVCPFSNYHEFDNHHNNW